MTLIDISRTVSPRTAVFPGDTPFNAELRWSLAQGGTVNLTTLTTTPHVGTHADAYFHYAEPKNGGVHPLDMPLDAYIGRARVMTVTKRRGALHPQDLPGSVAGAERLLLHTHSSDLPDEVWSTDFPWLSVELIEHLAAAGIRLIGVDTPSVDDPNSAALPGHKALIRHQIVNLENLFLRDVADGDYELIAPPLKLDDACASPVRAVLRPLA